MAAEKHGGYTTFVDLPEAVMLDNLCGGHKQMTQILRLIHDRSRYQALRATVDGITGSAILRTNISMASNPTDIRKFLKYNLLDGTLGRIAFSYKPRSEKRDPNIPKIGRFDDGFYEELDRRMAPLNLCKGRFVIPQLNKVCRQLAAEICEYADLTDNDTGAASKKQLSVWAARGFIEYSAQTGLYSKTEKYLKGKREK